MSFKQGDVVAAPNSSLMMQVIADSYEQTTLCVLLFDKKKHLIELLSEELVKASVH